MNFIFLNPHYYIQFLELHPVLCLKNLTFQVLLFEALKFVTVTSFSNQDPSTPHQSPLVNTTSPAFHTDIWVYSVLHQQQNLHV